MKESATVLSTYFGTKLKVAELEHLNDGYKGSAKAHKKLESAKVSIVEKNFWIAELEQKTKEAK